MFTVALYTTHGTHENFHDRRNTLSKLAGHELRGLTLPNPQSPRRTTSDHCTAYHLKGGVITVYNRSKYMFCMETPEALDPILKELKIDIEEVHFLRPLR